MEQEKVTKISGWLTEVEIQEMTGFKTTTLWKLRQRGQLIWSKIGKKTFYKAESLQELLNKSLRNK